MLTNLLVLFLLCFLTSCSSYYDKMIITKANSSYYDLSKYDLQSFKVKVQYKELDKYLNYLYKENEIEHNVVIPGTVVYSVTVKPKKEINIELIDRIETNNETFDKALRLMADGGKDILDGFLSIWSGFTWEPIYNSQINEYKITNLSNGYLIEQTDESSKYTTKLLKNMQIEEALIQEGKSKIILNPSFYELENKYLLKNYYMKINNEFNCECQIEYDNKSGYFLPKKLLISAVINGKNEQYTFIFYGYELN